MKNKFIFIVFAAVLFSSIAGFAAADNDVVAKKAVSKKSVGRLVVRANALEDQVRLLKSQKVKDKGQNKGNENSPLQFNLLDSLVEIYSHGPVVVTSLVLGMHRHDDGYYGLMVKSSSMSEDLVLLWLRQKMETMQREI